MVSSESRRGRRVVARLGRGADLYGEIRALCQKHEVRSGELRGAGTLEQAELDAFDQAARAWRPARLVKGGLELLHLQGTISEERGKAAIDARVTLMRDRDAGVEVLGGHVHRAVVHSVELVIDCFDDLLLRRGDDAGTGLSCWSEAIPVADPVPMLVPEQPAEPPAPARPTAPAPTWAEVAAASAPAGSASPPAGLAPRAAATIRAPAGDDEPEVTVNAGDVLIHPRFGRCLVHRVEGNGEYVQVQLRNGRVVRLSLEVLRLHAQGVENGQRIFTATVQ
jgi:predicted DNA-binding protein with PD1-like motif